MNSRTTSLIMIILLSSAVALVGCGDDDDDSPAVTAVDVTPASVPTLPLNQSQQFIATITYDDGATEDGTSFVLWKSSDTGVVTIEETGLAITRASGTADISADFEVASNVVTMQVDAGAPPPPTDTGDYNPDNVCDAEFCATDDALKNTCQNFLAACIAAEPTNEDECVGGALVICQNPDVDAGIVCDYGVCGTDPDLQQQCQNFMAICIDESANAEECVGAMLFFCRPEE